MKRLLSRPSSTGVDNDVLAEVAEQAADRVFGAPTSIVIEQPGPVSNQPVPLDAVGEWGAAPGSGQEHTSTLPVPNVSGWERGYVQRFGRLVDCRAGVFQRLAGWLRARGRARADRRVVRTGRQWTLEQENAERHVPPQAGRANSTSGRPRFLPSTRGAVFTAPTTQGCGLFPFVIGSGAPHHGVPLGPHLMDGETVCFSPLEWLRHGFVTNPTVFQLGQPGIGKSATAKRVILGEAAVGTLPLILGDVKPDYVGVVNGLGGQVISLGRGRDKLNPLDAGPVAAAAQQLWAAGHTTEANRLQQEANGRRLSLLVAICSLGRRDTISNAEEIMLAEAITHFDDLGITSPLISDVIALLKDPSSSLIDACNYDTAEEFRAGSRDLINTLLVMVRGSLRGIFDGPTSQPIDLSASAIEIDISSIAGVDDEQGVSAAMLAVWSYAFGVVDAEIALSEAGLAPRRNYLAVLDELWRALRGAPGLVDRADAMTRVNRQRRMAVMMITHSLDDLEALPTESDRAKAKGLVDRSGTVLIGAIPPNELDEVSKHIPGGLNQAERDLVASWSAPSDWSGDNVHPGLGKVLIKTGNRRGLPVHVQLTATEQELYQTTHLAGGEDR